MIYLVRHGETQFNAARRLQGALDSPLTPRGRDQGRRLGALLRSLIEPDEDWGIVASPLGRAQATAALIRDALHFAPPVETDERLREITLGSWDGLTFDDIDAISPSALDDRFGWQFRSPDGESYEAMCGRLGGWLEDAHAGGRRLIAVSHGISGLVLRGLYSGQPREAAMRAGSPQDAVFRLADGQVTRIGLED